MKQLSRNVYRILIAEPDATVRDQLVRALRDVYDVRETDDGRAAIEMLHNERDLPDAVITDLDLEGVGGLHLLVAAHSIDPYLPVLVVTPPERLDAALEALRLGARDCIVKPFESVEMLRYSVERAIEDRALPEEKERLQHELQGATRLKERLLRLVSEDFRQMLDEFNDYVRAVDEGSDASAALLARVRHTARWMSLRTGQVSTYAEIEKYPPKLNPALLSLERSVEEALARIPYDPATLAVEIERPMPRVTADPKRLGQVLENILVSAVQYSAHGGTIRVRARRREDAVECEVIDAGQPVENILLANMFEPFARQNRPKIAGVHSTGLGLCIARTLVELLGGRIRLENTAEGVAYRFTLVPARE